MPDKGEHPLKQHAYTHRSGGSDPLDLTGLGGADITGYLKKTGGVMSGLLTLSGNPTADLHAASKKYVDERALQVGWEIIVP